MVLEDKRDIIKDYLNVIFVILEQFFLILENKYGYFRTVKQDISVNLINDFINVGN